MKERTCEALAAAAFLCLLAVGGCARERGSAGKDVYVTTSPRAYSYHSTPSCLALRRTSYPVERMTRDEAENMGRRPCGICSQ